MFTSNQEKQLFFTAGSASFGVCEENFFPCHGTGALLSLADQSTLSSIHSKSHGFPGAPSASKLQITVALVTVHQQGFQETQRSKMEQKCKERQKRNYCIGDSGKMLPQPSSIIATLIESWPWAAFHLNAGHGLANHGSGGNPMSSSSQGKLCPQTWNGADPEWTSSNMEQPGCWVLGTKWSHPLLAGARKFLERALKSSGSATSCHWGTAWDKSHPSPLPQLLCLINMGNGANSLL